MKNNQLIDIHNMNLIITVNSVIHDGMPFKDIFAVPADDRVELINAINHDIRLCLFEQVRTYEILGEEYTVNYSAVPNKEITSWEEFEKIISSMKECVKRGDWGEYEMCETELYHLAQEKKIYAGE